MPVRAKKPEPYLKVVPLVPKHPSGDAVVVETVPGYPDMFKAVLRDGGPLGVAETPHLALLRLASNLRETAAQVEKIAHQKPFAKAYLRWRSLSRSSRRVEP